MTLSSHFHGDSLAASDEGFLAGIADLDIAAIATSADSTIITDDDLVIRAYNQAYLTFAHANGLLNPERRCGIGCSLLAGSNEPARSFYTQAFQTVLAEHGAFHQDYECSSPTERREFRLSAYATVSGQALVISHHLVIAEPIPTTDQVAYSPAHCSPDGFVIQCCHCRKVRNFTANERWDWVPSCVESMPNNVSHTFCPRCFDHYYPDIDAPGED